MTSGTRGSGGPEEERVPAARRTIDVPTDFEPATSFESGTAQPLDGLRVYLLVRDHAAVRVLNVLDGQTVLFGRVPEADVQIEDSRASRRHAELRRTGRDLVLTDLGSRNGTKVNGQRVRGQAVGVSGGDVIRIGPVESVVAVAEARVLTGEGQPVGGRIEAELARILAVPGAKATLACITLDAERHPHGLDAIAEVLRGAVLVEEHGEDEYLALLEGGDPRVTERMLAGVRRVPGLSVNTVVAPDQGRTAEQLWQRARAGQGRPALSDTREGVVVADAAMVEVFHLARKLAAVQTTVLILGETGVGKEVIAEQIHRWSPRAQAPFVRLNCASLPETLLESELFGHERGAFTGADRRKIGYLEAAQGGTLLLDEIGELPLNVQVKLLNVLENRTVRRLGGTQEYPIDVRVLAATHRDLERQVREGRFREDLYYRLSAFKLTVPPLRERQAEVALLAEMFAQDSASRAARPPPVIEQSALRALLAHPWPGNVRELRNAMEHAVVLAEDGHIRAEHLPESMRKRGVGATLVAAASALVGGGDVKTRIADLERRSIEEALAAESGNQTRAAKRLGLSRRALIYKLEKYGLKRP